MKNVLLYGGGTQSTGLLLMCLDGKINIELDMVIFSDTQAEPGFVYDYINRVKKYVNDKYDKDVEIYKGLNLEHEIKTKYKIGERVASLPLYLSNGGMIMRQCTGDYKISPISKIIKERFNIERKRKNSKPIINRIFGISLDEMERCKQSVDWWATNSYPLVFERMYRHEVINYININHPELINPPRSSCYFCPFHSNTYWRNLKEKHPAEFEKACEIDETIRDNPKLNNKAYLHKSRKPLREVDFKKYQNEIFGECEGYCGM